MFRVLDIYYNEVCVEVKLTHDYEDNNDIEYYARLYSEPEQLEGYLGDFDIEVEIDDKSIIINAIKNEIKNYVQSIINSYSVDDIYMEIECTEPNHKFDLEDLEWGEIVDVSFVGKEENVDYTLEEI